MGRYFGKVIASSKTWKDERPVYSVTNTNKYGTFTSTVSPCDEDMNNINDFIGYGLCERKNYIKTIHRKAMNLKERALGIENAFQALTEKYSANMRITEEKADFLIDLGYQADVAWREYNKVYEQYKYMYNDYHDFADRIIEKHNKDKQHAEEYRVKLAEQKAVQAIKDLHDVVTEN